MRGDAHPRRRGALRLRGGTSFAAPEVAGIAALVWSVKPSLTACRSRGSSSRRRRDQTAAGWTLGDGLGRAEREGRARERDRPFERRLARALGIADLAAPASRAAQIRRVRKGELGRRQPGRSSGPPVLPDRASEAPAMHSSAALEAGTATCTFRLLPKRSAGLPVAGSVSVSATGGLAASASFRFAVAGRQPG